MRQFGLRPVVHPDGWCQPPGRKGKHAFNTEEKASQALEAARENRRLLNNPHSEERFYECPFGELGGAARRHYHLTSQSLEEYENRPQRTFVVDRDVVGGDSDGEA